MKIKNPLLKSFYHQAEDYFFSSISVKDHHFNDGVVAYLTDTEIGNLNAFIVKKCEADFCSVLEEGILLFDAAGLPFTVMVPDDAIDRAEHQLNALGLTIAYNTVAMYLSMERFLPQSMGGIDTPIMSTDNNLFDWGRPLESAFEGSPELTLQYRLRHQAAVDRGKNIFHFSLYVENQPVCSLTLSLNNKIARLDDIGTQKEFQGKGYASALIQHALIYAQACNVSACFLEASKQGASLYSKLGFSTLFTYAAFQRQ